MAVAKIAPRFSERLKLDGRDQQGQRSLKRCSGQDFQQEVVAPTATAAFHGEAFAAGMLLQQRQAEAVEPRKILTHVLVANARRVLAIGDVETPGAAALNAPVTADGVGESLHAYPEAAD